MVLGVYQRFYGVFIDSMKSQSSDEFKALMVRLCGRLGIALSYTVKRHRGTVKRHLRACDRDV